MISIKRSSITLLSYMLPLPRKSFFIKICRVSGASFFTGGKDAKIFEVDLMGNPLNMFEGHESAVNSLSQCIPEELVSGSWDG